MTQTLMDTQQLTELVVNHTDPSPYGIDCKFIKIDNKWGIKIYRSSTKRYKAHHRQSKLFTCGLAPDVGVCFDVNTLDGNLYCYVTQYAEPITEGTKEYCTHYYSIIREIKEKYPSIDDEIHTLCTSMQAVEGRRYSDVHYANFGRINGKLVCIDFGD